MKLYQMKYMIMKKSLIISYKKEIKLGETVKCKYSFVNNTHVICVKSEDDTKLHSVIEFFE